VIEFLFEILIPGAAVVGLVCWQWPFKTSRLHLLWILPAVAVFYIGVLDWIAH
jgi:hypothetical protein